jgi:hypothetical protein
LLTKELEGNQTPETSVPRLIHLAHAASAQQRDYLVRAKPNTQCERHGISLDYMVKSEPHGKERFVSSSRLPAVYNEVVANLMSNSHLAPAGILIVKRAQERGYSFASAG